MEGLNWYVYILSCSDGTYYTGITNNLKKRIKTHNSGKGSKYTRSRLPVFFVYIKTSENRSTASKEEYRIKSLKKSEKIKLISNNNYDLNSL